MQVTVIILADFIVKLVAFCGVLDILLGALCNQYMSLHMWPHCRANSFTSERFTRTSLRFCHASTERFSEVVTAVFINESA